MANKNDTSITNEKLFDFMTMMYNEMQTMHSEMQTMNGRITNIEGNMATNQDISRLEEKMDTNHIVLHDGYKLNYEKLITLESKVDEIDKKVDKHDVEIRVIKGATNY